MEDAHAVSKPARFKRLAGAGLAVGLGIILIGALDIWQARPVEAVLVHQLDGFPTPDTVDIEVLAWGIDDYLHAEAAFFNVRSLSPLEHTIRVPPGKYRITLSAFQSQGVSTLRLQSEVTIAEPGRYFVHYSNRLRESWRP